MLLRNILNINISNFLAGLIAAIFYLTAGFLLGLFVNKALKKLSKQARLEKGRSYNFIRLFITIITWSIYILFIYLALVELNIPLFTRWLTSILVVIPAVTGALVLIVVGFTIATYLKNVIEESKIDGGKILSETLYFFALYVFSVFALKTALITIDSQIVNYLILILTGIIGLGIAYRNVRKE
ncbi:MAG: hypothetical protein AABW73_02525 [Nanoarchaeota archaeon]